MKRYFRLCVAAFRFAEAEYGLWRATQEFDDLGLKHVDFNCERCHMTKTYENAVQEARARYLELRSEIT